MERREGPVREEKTRGDRGREERQRMAGVRSRDGWRESRGHGGHEQG